MSFLAVRPSSCVSRHRPNRKMQLMRPSIFSKTHPLMEVGGIFSLWKLDANGSCLCWAEWLRQSSFGARPWSLAGLRRLCWRGFDGIRRCRSLLDLGGFCTRSGWCHCVVSANRSTSHCTIRSLKQTRRIHRWVRLADLDPPQHWVDWGRSWWPWLVRSKNIR